MIKNQAFALRTFLEGHENLAGNILRSMPVGELGDLHDELLKFRELVQFVWRDKFLASDYKPGQ
jgi:hypothetical protein